MTNEKIEELALKLDQGESPYIVAIQALGLACQLHSELAALRSCPGMGEVDALVESYSFSSSRQGCKEKFLELADLARRYAVALTEERERADERERLLKKCQDVFGEDMERVKDCVDWSESYRRILAICGKGDG